jgi:hypothetical protein
MASKGKKEGGPMARWVARNWMWVVALGTTVVYAPLAGRTGEERLRARSVDALAEVMSLVQ